MSQTPSFFFRELTVIWHTSEEGHCVPHRASNTASQNISAIYKNERKPQRGSTARTAVHKACSVCLPSIFSETSATRPFKGLKYTSSPACPPNPPLWQRQLHTHCQTHQPVRAALCSASKTIYALTFSWWLLGSCMIWRKKISYSHVLQPVADMYSPAPALSFILWLFPKALIQIAALFSRHFSRVWLNQTNL